MSVDDADIRSMLLTRAGRAHAPALRRIAVEAARATPQFRSLTRPTAQARAGWPMRLAAAIATVAIVTGAVALALELRPTAPATPGAAISAAPAATRLPTPPPADIPVTAPPYVAGSCPVTPVTDLVGGEAPEVVTGGIGWMWGPAPWQAKVGQKVVFEKTSLDQPYLDARVIIAERLTIGTSGKPLSVRYPRGTGPGFVFGVGLPEPGCWLLTAVGPTVRSSVVVEAAPATPNPPADQNVPTGRSQLGLVSPCPTSPIDASPVRTWLDGMNRWQDPEPAAWMAGMKRKLVFSGVFANSAPFELVAAARVGIVGPADSQQSAFVSEAPAFATPAPGGQSKAMELILPTAGCWAITYVDPVQTSTIVVEIGK